MIKDVFLAVTRAKPCSGYRSCSGPHKLFCVRSNIQGYDELFRLCCHTRQQKPSQSAFRTFSVSGYLPQCADCRTRTDRPVRSPTILSPAHTSAVDGELSFPGQSVGMAMMCFHSQPPAEYGETDDIGMYPVHRKGWSSDCTRSQSVYRWTPHFYRVM